MSVSNVRRPSLKVGVICVCVCVSLLALLCVCDGGHGSLTLADVADARPLTVHRLLPQRHLQNNHITTSVCFLKKKAFQCQYASLSLYIHSTLLSPPETASIFPVIDQLTCQTTSLNLWSSLAVQVFPAGSSHVQINTRPS